MPYVDLEKRLEYARLWVAKRRAVWFAEHGPCVDCRSWVDLELDHIDPTTKVSHSIWSWRPARMQAETAKCVVRCKVCHWKKTLAVDRHRTAHGQLRMYQKLGCRCPLCAESEARFGPGLPGTEEAFVALGKRISRHPLKVEIARSNRVRDMVLSSDGRAAGSEPAGRWFESIRISLCRVGQVG